MKTQLLSVVFAVLSISTVFAQIPNGDFNNSTTESGCTQPAGWNTVNGSTGTFGLCTAESETNNSYSGAAALKITSEFFFFAGQVIPGLVSNGDIDIQNQSVTGGIPFTERPTAFTGWYRAEPENGDTYQMIAVLINENTGDSVGVAIFEGTNTVTDWTAFNQPVQYLNQQTPTLLQITMFASDPTDPQDGSTVWFDELDYESITVGIDENESQNIFAYPNPARNTVSFNLTSSENVLVEVYNLLGVKMSEFNVSNTNNTIDTSALSAGTYVWQMSSSAGESFKTGKLLVVR